jgi:hypothetical protein
VITRRGLLAFGLGVACSRKEVGAPTSLGAPAARAPVAAATGSARSDPLPSPVAAPDATAPRGPTLVDWDLGAHGHAVALVSPIEPGTKVPLVIALHGRGEALKGPVRGPYGWPRDYALERAIGRITKPPLTAEDFERLVDGERLGAINARLARRPFGGLAVVCPFLPDFDWSHPPTELVTSYARFLVDELIPRARQELPVIATAAATGIDGVSLGGAMGLRVGLRFAEHFGAVGSLQCALTSGNVDELVQMAKAARRKNPALALRVATSKEDGFGNSNRALSRALTAAAVEHGFEDHLGPHDYIWNRGPGSYELLLFQDSALTH